MPCLGPCPFIKLFLLEAAVHRIQTRFINIHYVTEQQAAAFVVHGLKDYRGRAVHTDGTEEGMYPSYGTFTGLAHMLWEEELIPGEGEEKAVKIIAGQSFNYKLLVLIFYSLFGGDRCY